MNTSQGKDYRKKAICTNNFMNYEIQLLCKKLDSNSGYLIIGNIKKNDK